jgi:GTPase SAR1 family protein
VNPDAIACHSVLREELGSVLRELSALAIEQNVESVGRSIAEMVTKLDQNRFHMVVVGQFKRGKTSFLNALLGESILPVAILPLTSVVTVLRYGNERRAEVIFHSGERLDIATERLADFVTESGNPENAKGVEHVEVFHPGPLFRAGVTLVDTPGIGSIYAHNTQVTYDFLPRIDAAIFVTSPEPPVTAAEIELLSALASEVPKIFVVMNKTDLFPAPQIAEVLEFASGALPKSLATKTGGIMPVSARQALQASLGHDLSLRERSGFPRLERELDRFLTEERSMVFLRSTARNAVKCITDFKMHIMLQIQAAEMPLEELRAKTAELQEALQRAGEQQEADDFLLNGNLARLHAVVSEEVKNFAESRIEEVRSGVRAFLRQNAGLSRIRLAEALDQFVLAQIREAFEPWRQDYEAAAAKRFREVCSRFQSRVNDLIRNVRGTAGKLFAFAIADFEASEELAFIEASRYHTDPLLDWGLGKRPLLLPGAFYRRYLLKQTMDGVPRYLDRNATRVAYDFKRRIDKSVSAFQQALNAKLTETCEGIRSAVEQALRRQESGSIEMRHHMNRIGNVEAILEQLAFRTQQIASQLADEPGGRALG